MHGNLRQESDDKVDFVATDEWRDRLARLAVSLLTSRSRVLVRRGRVVQESKPSEWDIQVPGRDREASAFITAIRVHGAQTDRELIDTFWERANSEDGPCAPRHRILLMAFAWQTVQELDDTI